MHNSPIPKVAAIHDLSCFGRAALSVVIPILSTLGVQVCPLPTAIFSSHGRFPGYSSQDLTEQLEAIIAHWNTLGLEFDAIYSGFLNSPRQIDILSEFLRDFSRNDPLVVIDPVLGDHGKMYGIMAQEMLPHMKRYIRLAHVITPNPTEAALLLDEPYRPDISRHDLHAQLVRLTELGPNIAVLTGAPAHDLPGDHIRIMAYDRKTQQFLEMTTERHPANFPGTGDAFTSVVVGSLVRGASLQQALQRAMQFLSSGIALSSRSTYPEEEGMLLELALNNLILDP